MTSVTNSEKTTSLLATWKSFASRSIRKTTTKKSNASSVQPRNDAATACACPERERPGTPLSRPLFNNASSWNRFGLHALRYVAIQDDGAKGRNCEQNHAAAHAI